MEDASVESNGVDEFLMTITEVKDFLSENESPKPPRIDVFQAIQKSITERLGSAEDPEDDWLLQLIELELEEENKSDKSSYIARLLTGYVVNRPWVFQLEALRPKVQSQVVLYKIPLLK